MLKRFLEWIELKEKLNKKDYEPPFFKENEIWWCHVGENIGSEINGKSEIFTRPVFVFKKYDRYSFFGLPLSTKDKTGSWYAPVIFASKKQVIVLCQGRVFDYRRLMGKMGELDKTEVSDVRNAYFALHKAL